MGSKPQQQRIKAVFFDLDDTVVLTTEADKVAHQVVQQTAKEHYPQLNSVELLDVWRRLFAASPWDTSHQVPVEEWRAGLWHQALLQQGIGDWEFAAQLQSCFAASRLEHFQIEPGVQELFMDLRAKGIQLVIITNGHHEVQRIKLHRIGADQLVDGLIVGGEEVLAGGEEKPAAAIFLKACHLVGCQPHEAVHVGDSLAADVQGGINAGLAATVWVNRKGRPLSAAGPHPNHAIQSVTDLPEVLPELFC